MIVLNVGTAMAVSTPAIDTVVINSISVNPDAFTGILDMAEMPSDSRIASEPSVA